MTHFSTDYEQGIKDERERIIKLLENPYYHHTFFGPRDVNDEPVILHDGECIGCMAISEIKGETEVSVENIINNPPKEFTEPCEACGISEFQLGVRHAEERIIKLLKETHSKSASGWCANDSYDEELFINLESLIALVEKATNE